MSDAEGPITRCCAFCGLVPVFVPPPDVPLKNVPTLARAKGGDQAATRAHVGGPSPNPSPRGDRDAHPRSPADTAAITGPTPPVPPPTPSVHEPRSPAPRVDGSSHRGAPGSSEAASRWRPWRRWRTPSGKQLAIPAHHEASPDPTSPHAPAPPVQPRPGRSPATGRRLKPNPASARGRRGGDAGSGGEAGPSGHGGDSPAGDPSASGRASGSTRRRRALEPSEGELSPRGEAPDTDGSREGCSSSDDSEGRHERSSRRSRRASGPVHRRSRSPAISGGGHVRIKRVQSPGGGGGGGAPPSLRRTNTGTSPDVSYRPHAGPAGALSILERFTDAADTSGSRAAHGAGLFSPARGFGGADTASERRSPAPRRSSTGGAALELARRSSSPRKRSLHGGQDTGSVGGGEERVSGAGRRLSRAGNGAPRSSEAARQQVDAALQRLRTQKSLPRSGRRPSPGRLPSGGAPWQVPPSPTAAAGVVVPLRKTPSMGRAHRGRPSGGSAPCSDDERTSAMNTRAGGLLGDTHAPGMAAWRPPSGGGGGGARRHSVAVLETAHVPALQAASASGAGASTTGPAASASGAGASDDDPHTRLTSGPELSPDDSSASMHHQRRGARGTGAAQRSQGESAAEGTGALGVGGIGVWVDAHGDVQAVAAKLAAGAEAVGVCSPDTSVASGRAKPPSLRRLASPTARASPAAGGTGGSHRTPFAAAADARVQPWHLPASAGGAPAAKSRRPPSQADSGLVSPSAAAVGPAPAGSARLLHASTMPVLSSRASAPGDLPLLDTSERFSVHMGLEHALGELEDTSDPGSGGDSDGNGGGGASAGPPRVTSAAAHNARGACQSRPLTASAAMHAASAPTTPTPARAPPAAAAPHGHEHLAVAALNSPAIASRTGSPRGVAAGGRSALQTQLRAIHTGAVGGGGGGGSGGGSGSSAWEGAAAGHERALAITHAAAGASPNSPSSPCSPLQPHLRGGSGFRASPSLAGTAAGSSLHTASVRPSASRLGTPRGGASGTPAAASPLAPPSRAVPVDEQGVAIDTAGTTRAGRSPAPGAPVPVMSAVMLATRRQQSQQLHTAQ